MYFFKSIVAASIVSSAFAASPSFNVSSNNTILQNLQALAMSSNSSSSVSYINLLLGMNTSCTSQVAQLLNSSEVMNLTFFAPSDSAFNNITGWPDLGENFCQNCNSSSSSSNSRLRSALGSGSGSGSGGSSSSNSTCNPGCNSTALGINATASELAPCLSEILQYHVLNESLYFNETRFGFLNRSSTNVTVLPTYLNSSCLVHLSNSTNSTSGGASDSSSNQTQSNNQYLVFNITNNNTSSSSDGSGQGQSSSSNMTSPYNVTILHGINTPANVTSYDIQSSNGVLHIIDAVLIPPANFSQTLNYTYNMTQQNGTAGNSTSGGSSSNSSLPFLNQTDLSMIANMTGITVLLPDPEGMQGMNSTSSGSSFNVTDYIFPQVIFNNQSFVNIGNLSDGVFLQQNFTNINGQNVTFLFGRNYSVIVNGTQITKSNILMDNGVLHLLNSTQLFSQSQLPTQGQSAMSRILRFFKAKY